MTGENAYDMTAREKWLKIVSTALLQPEGNKSKCLPVGISVLLYSDYRWYFFFFILCLFSKFYRVSMYAFHIRERERERERNLPPFFFCFKCKCSGIKNSLPGPHTYNCHRFPPSLPVHENSISILVLNDCTENLKKTQFPSTG